MTSRAFKGAAVETIESRLRVGGEQVVKSAPVVGWVENVAPEVVHARVAAVSVLPASLAVACTAHGAEVGVRCFSAGVCGDRVRRGISSGGAA